MTFHCTCTKPYFASSVGRSSIHLLFSVLWRKFYTATLDNGSSVESALKISESKPAIKVIFLPSTLKIARISPITRYLRIEFSMVSRDIDRFQVIFASRNGYRRCISVALKGRKG